MGMYTARMKPVKAIAERLEGQMKWTTEKPTKPGWYWYRLTPASEYSVVELVWSTGLFNTPAVPGLREVRHTVAGRGHFSIEGVRGEWQGPIEPED